MDDIHKSTQRYEKWLHGELGREVVEKDLARKHEKMTESAFAFLRATYWRWAETVFEICPEIAKAPRVLAVGDIHLENFGTWRDADGRLVWGVNDFDEAAEMPYVLDVVRLATSALVAGKRARVAADAVCNAILSGYREGLKQPQPAVLDRDRPWLRALVDVPDKARAKFWTKIETAKAEQAPPRYRRMLIDAMPEAHLALAKTARRVAGAGSLGRPRWVGVADWRGAPVVREVKALVPSAWLLSHGKRGTKLHCGDIANGRHRAMDPWYRISGNTVVRRLSPNNRKIEAGKEPGQLLSADMLQAMGADLAAVHLGVSDHRAAIDRDLRRRKPGWLKADAVKMAKAVEADYAAWKAAAPAVKAR